MNESRLSRREFIALSGTGAAAAPFARSRAVVPAAAAITAQQIVDRIRQHLGVEWKAETVDTFKAGDPATAVKGIVATAMPRLTVLQQAVKAGATLVITCEPTFYGRADTPSPPRRGAGPGAAAAGRSAAGPRGGASSSGQAPSTQAAPAATPADPVFAAKADFIRRNNLVVWRFTDHWRLRTPDPFAEGLADVLGWQHSRDKDDPSRVSIRAMTLGTLASEVKKKLDARGGIRVVGDPRIQVQRIGLLPGATPLQAALNTLPDVDAVIAGEVREWEGVEYARDLVTAGEEKGLILVGRILSEDPGMNVCARWLGPIVPEVRTTWIGAGDPYWRPL